MTSVPPQTSVITVITPIGNFPTGKPNTIKLYSQTAPWNPNIFVDYEAQLQTPFQLPDKTPQTLYYSNVTEKQDAVGKPAFAAQYNSTEKKITYTLFDINASQVTSVVNAAITDSAPSKTLDPSGSKNSANSPTGSASPGLDGPQQSPEISQNSSPTTGQAGQTRLPSKNIPNTPGVTSGAAAGIAIGCLIAGALIAGALLWFFCIRSKKRRGTRDTEASSVALIRNEKGPVAKTTSLESGSPLSRSLDNGLPQPLEDGAISGEVSKLSNLIKNHVQSFYHQNRAGLGLLDLDDLQALGNGLPISPGTLSTLLGNVDTREIALRFSIAWAIISRIQPSGDPGTTFLPPEVATCFQSIPVTEHRTRAQTNYLSKWRSVTAELMQSSYGRSTFPVTDPRTRNIEKAANILDGILRPYMDSRVNNNERRRNLEEILKRAAIFAFTLFSQPSTWDFDWRAEEGVQSNSLCIFPALVQVTDELGDPVKPPRALSEAVVRKLDG